MSIVYRNQTKYIFVLNQKEQINKTENFIHPLSLERPTQNIYIDFPKKKKKNQSFKIFCVQNSMKLSALEVLFN